VTEKANYTRNKADTTTMSMRHADCFRCELAMLVKAFQTCAMVACSESRVCETDKRALKEAPR
jgi:hypothetical protein